MEATLKVALGEQEHLQEFFALMKSQGRGGQAEDIAGLLKQMEEMRSDFSDALEEIKYLREQIDAMHDQTAKAKLRKMQEEVQVLMKQAQNRALSVKKDIETNIRNVVATGKQKGMQALDKVFDVLPIYQGLGVLESYLQSSVNTLSQRIGKIDTLADEVHAVKNHVRNAGRVVAGKPIMEMDERDHDKGILVKLEKSVDYYRKLIAGIMLKTVMARAHVEHFRELSGKKAEEVPTVSEIANKMREKVSMPIPQKMGEVRS